jgi:predicted PurR-regulated permease PerM
MYWMGVVAFLVFAFAFVVRDALLPFIVAFLVAYALNPAVSWMEEKKIPRALGVLILLACVGLAFTGLVLLAYPQMDREVRSVASQAPEYGRRLSEQMGPLMVKYGGYLGYDANAALRSSVEKFGSIPPEILRWAYSVVSSALSSATAFAMALLGFLIVPVASFYLLLDYSEIRDRFFSLVPARHRGRVNGIVEDVNKTLSAYVRGQLVVVITLGTIYTTGLSLIGAPMAAFVGILSGLAVIVPYMPLAIGLLPSLLLTYLYFGDLLHPVAVLALYGGAQAFEGFYLTPHVMGRSVGLHPVAIMVSVFIGGLLLGVVGVIAAVPTAAVVKVLLSHLESGYRSSPFFKGE